MDWPAGTSQTVIDIKLYNLSIYVPPQPTTVRSYAISTTTVHHRLEAYSNDITCDSNAEACQGISCFEANDCKFHHNRINMQKSATNESGRALAYNGGTLNGEAWNNDITTNDNRAVRVRDSFNVRIHDNTFRQINCCPIAGAVGAIHLADPDTGINDLNVVIDHNTFDAQGGNLIFIRNGINAFVRNNKVTCTGCFSGELFASVRAGIQTEITLSDNQDVILNLPSPQIFVEGGAQATICNSGIAFGAGTIIPIFTSPCP
jgi:hypothetical protein